MRADGLDLVRRFVGAINRHDLEELSALLAPGHRFIDSLGSEISGREEVARAWRGYFEMVPDYFISVSRLLREGTDVAVFGTASGSIAVAVGRTEKWSLPFAARASVESGRVAEWQVYADNEPVRALLRSSPPA